MPWHWPPREVLPEVIEATRLPRSPPASASVSGRGALEKPNAMIGIFGPRTKGVALEEISRYPR
jgi:hypothetical protein